jgi:hypothetical protein
MMETLRLDGDEKIRAVLGGENKSGNRQKPVVVLTNKRIWFIGEHYRYAGGNLSRKIRDTEFFPLRDFIGAGRLNNRPRRNLYLLLWTGMSVVFVSRFSKFLEKFGLRFHEWKPIIWIASGAFILLSGYYLLRRYRVFEMAFVGNRICVKEKHFRNSEIQSFIAAIYREKQKGV